jgi:uncharacterized tellurite resistance protein B-like protein
LANGGTFTNNTRTHINMLVQLARVDGVVVQEEIDLITKIATGFGMSSDEISACFEDPSQIGDLSNLPDDQKFEYIYNMVQLMKIDGRLYKEEIQYCAKMANNLGYDEEVLTELMLKIYSDPHISADKASVKSSVQKYLK